MVLSGFAFSIGSDPSFLPRRHNDTTENYEGIQIEFFVVSLCRRGFI
jgi:hypothetical protein